jgi:hypothetical protein
MELKISYNKKQWRPPCKKKKRGKNLSPRNRKACHSVSTAHNLFNKLTQGTPIIVFSRAMHSCVHNGVVSPMQAQMMDRGWGIFFIHGHCTPSITFAGPSHPSPCRYILSAMMLLSCQRLLPHVVDYAFPYCARLRDSPSRV